MENFDEIILSDFYKKLKKHLLIEIFLGLIILCLIGFLIFVFSYDYIDFHRNKIAPSDRIQKKDILVYEDKVVINISNARLSKYLNTGSMLPTLNENSNGLQISPKNENDIKIGDIITYQKEQEVCVIPENETFVCPALRLVVHRVIEIGEDKKGIYYITKGDNNKFSDRKIRYNQIKSITFAIIF